MVMSLYGCLAHALLQAEQAAACKTTRASCQVLLLTHCIIAQLLLER